MLKRRFGVNLAPQFYGEAALTVLENRAPGTLVGKIAAADPDPGDVIEYRLVGETPFVIDAFSGELRVGPGAQLDHETTPQHLLTIEVVDNRTPPLSRRQTQIVTIADANEAPLVPPGIYSIAEFSPLGAIVGTVSATDPEGGPLAYLIVGASPFAIDSVTGVISVANPVALDRDLQSQYTLTVAAAETGPTPLQGTTSITINIQPGTSGHSTAPLLVGLPTKIVYDESNESLPVAHAASITDADNSTLVGGILRVQIGCPAATDEFLLAAVPGVVIDGANVRVADILVGVIHSTGQHGTPLEIVLHAGATPGRVEALLRAVHYRTTVAPVGDRHVMVTVNDGGGGQTAVHIAVGPPTPGDFDSDGDVDGRDFLIWQRNPTLGALADWQSGYGSPISVQCGLVEVEPQDQSLGAENVEIEGVASAIASTEPSPGLKRSGRLDWTTAAVGRAAMNAQSARRLENRVGERMGSEQPIEEPASDRRSATEQAEHAAMQFEFDEVFASLFA
jgi:hypothetical protein